MSLRLLALFVALLPAPALADEPAPDLATSWALRISDATIFRFDLSPNPDGSWSGVWTRPESFASNGAVFARMSGSREVPAMAGLDLAGEVELSFDDPRPGAIPDIFRFRYLGAGQAQLSYVGTELEPYPLIEVAPGTPLGPFVAGRLYDRDNAQSEPDAALLEAPAPVLQQPQQEPDGVQPGIQPPIVERRIEPRIGTDFLDGF